LFLFEKAKQRRKFRNLSFIKPQRIELQLNATQHFLKIYTETGRYGVTPIWENLEKSHYIFENFEFFTECV
jgi:hypothetical protein